MLKCKGIKNKLLKVVVMTLIFTMLASTMAVAQPLKGDELTVSIWPEYTEPGVLIIYSGEITNTSSEPFEDRIVLNIPAGVNRAEMVCEYGPTGNMMCQQYRINEVEGANYAELSWHISQPLAPGETLPFMAEFFYNPIEGQQADKSFSYDFVASFDIDSLLFYVKEPFDASDFTLEPEFDYRGEDNFGLNQFTYQIFNLAQGESEVVSLSYSREDDGPSIDRGQATGGGQTNHASNDGGDNSFNSTTGILLVSFLGLMGFFIFYALKVNSDNQKGTASKAKSTKKRAGKNNNDSVGSSDSSVESEKKKIRKMLLDGKISEETYKELIKELDK